MTIAPEMTLLNWTGLESGSREVCQVKKDTLFNEITSVISELSTWNELLHYKIKTNHRWETQLVEIQKYPVEQFDKILFHSDTNGHWLQNGNQLSKFDGCFDVDISLTPFTNSLPINRLHLQTGRQHLVKVIYFDIEENDLKVEMQKYTHLSENSYRFETVPRDFETIITVDNDGFVIRYPELFERA